MLLPKVNGLELLQRYDIRGTHSDVKVIAFSNLSEERIKQEAESLGVSLYLNKSQVTPVELESAIARALAG
jgi:DNA-binding NarL/FixJ family response regulator